jgi:hypothetical protein
VFQAIFYKNARLTSRLGQVHRLAIQYPLHPTSLYLFSKRCNFRLVLLDINGASQASALGKATCKTAP